MAHHVYITFTRFFAHYGYWAIFITVFLQNTGVPAPGDTIVIFAGFISRRGSLRLGWTILAAVLSSILGQCFGFVIGRLGGAVVIEKYRRTLSLPQTHYARAQNTFLKNAAWAVFIARFVIVLRELAGLLSGVFRFPFSRFLLSNIGGAILWSVSMSCLGYFLNRSWKRLLHFVSRMDIVVLILFIILVPIVILQQRRAAGGKR